MADEKLSMKERRDVLLAMVQLESAGQLEDPDLRAVLSAARKKGWVGPKRTAGLGGWTGSETGDAILVSAGKTLSDLGRGVEGIFADDTEQAALDARTAEANQFQAAIDQEHPVAAFTGKALPVLATLPLGGAAAQGAGAGLKAVGAARAGAAVGGSLVADGALTGAAFGALDPNSSALMGGAAGLAGGVAGKALGKVISPGVAAREGTEEALAAANRLGMRVTPSQLGVPGTDILEAGVARNPITAGAAKSLNEHNSKVAARVANESMGATGDVFTPQTFKAARQALSDQFEDVTSGATVRLGDDFLDGLGNVEASFRSTWGAGDPTRKIIDDALDEIASTGGVIPAARYQTLRSDLGDLMVSAYRGSNDQLGRALARTREALDDAMESSLGPATRARFQDLRGKWRNMLFLEAPGVMREAEGAISPAVLANKLRSRDKAGYLYGGNNSDLYDLARVAKTFPPIGTSGTAEGLAGMAVPYALAAGTIVNAPATLGVVGGARAGAEALMRSGGYLQNQMLPQGVRDLMTLGGGRVAGAESIWNNLSDEERARLDASLSDNPLFQ